MATPRGTERRVNRHNSARAARGPVMRLRSICSRVGIEERTILAILWRIGTAIPW
jgi:hypothetical protein